MNLYLLLYMFGSSSLTLELASKQCSVCSSGQNTHFGKPPSETDAKWSLISWSEKSPKKVNFKLTLVHFPTFNQLFQLRQPLTATM